MLGPYIFLKLNKKFSKSAFKKAYLYVLSQSCTGLLKKALLGRLPKKVTNNLYIRYLLVKLIHLYSQLKIKSLFSDLTIFLTANFSTQQLITLFEIDNKIYESYHGLNNLFINYYYDSESIPFFYNIIKIKYIQLNLIDIQIKNIIIFMREHNIFFNEKRKNISSAFINQISEYNFIKNFHINQVINLAIYNKFFYRNESYEKKPICLFFNYKNHYLYNENNTIEMINILDAFFFKFYRNKKPLFEINITENKTNVTIKLSNLNDTKFDHVHMFFLLFQSVLLTFKLIFELKLNLFNSFEMSCLKLYKHLNKDDYRSKKDQLFRIPITEKTVKDIKNDQKRFILFCTNLFYSIIQNLGFGVINIKNNMAETINNLEIQNNNNIKKLISLKEIDDSIESGETQRNKITFNENTNSDLSNNLFMSINKENKDNQYCYYTLKTIVIVLQKTNANKKVSKLDISAVKSNFNNYYNLPSILNNKNFRMFYYISDIKMN